MTGVLVIPQYIKVHNVCVFFGGLLNQGLRCVCACVCIFCLIGLSFALEVVEVRCSLFMMEMR